MSKNGKRYSEEFKQQIVDLYNLGHSAKKLASEYGVTDVTIYKWIKEYSPITVSENEQISSKELMKMQKRIKELELENEILKKATAIFAKNR